MHLYTIEKTAMKAVKSILSMSEKTCSEARMWTRFAYLYEKGLICTDGVRLLRIHDTDLEKEFESFIRETGRVVVFSLQGDSLKMEYDIAKNDTEVGTMEKLIPTDERLNGKESGVFYNRFTEDGKTPKAKDIEKARKIIAGIKEAEAKGSGVISVNGKMVDRPVVLRAQRTIDLAIASGILTKEDIA
mgnify:CR=1 FL=1